jgi:hypothetical protein
MAELQEGWVVPSSEARLARLQRQLRGGRHGIAEAQAALADCCPAGSPDDVWEYLSNPGTIYSSIADPAALRLWVRVYDRPDRGWVDLDLAESLTAARPAA